MNSSYHEEIKMTPYQALNGNKPRCGLKSNLPDAFIRKISSGIEEEELERLIEVPLTGHSARNEPHPVADSQKQPAMEQENISTVVLHPAKQERKEAEYGLQKQAQQMLARSTRSMRAVDVGGNVSVPVSQFDRRLLIENIPKQKLSIRELVRAGSLCGGQGYQRCLYRSNCLSKRCSCLKASLRCNSACHNHISCDNIDK
ncbi:uncharacterized protein [Palaemon carinicauda]|uniref:uncharacterized protein n=1 Tax=Palaemon carinicauda TaxID=392227 RepID=UPI0035B605F1